MSYTNFNGQLKSNELFSALYNQIISEQVIVDNIHGTNSKLVDLFKTEGSMYGDTVLKVNGDILYSQEWTGDNEAANLLEVNRPDDPKTQAITIDSFRFVQTTIDSYLSKRSWGSEGTFGQFNSFILDQLGTTKRVFESTLINTFVGTHRSTAEGAYVEVDVSDAIDGMAESDVEGRNRVAAQTIAKALADLKSQLNDVSRDFNEYGHLQSYSDDQLIMIWNAEFVNKLTKLDMPTIFHNDKLFGSMDYVLPARYFGGVGTTAITKANNLGNKRSMIEADYATAVGAVPTHVFPGDLIPSGTAKVLTYNKSSASGYKAGKPHATAATLSAGIAANEYYSEDKLVIGVITTKDAVPFMSAFTSETSFVNPRALNENHYLVWGYSTPTALYARPFITLMQI